MRLMDIVRGWFVQLLDIIIRVILRIIINKLLALLEKIKMKITGYSDIQYEPGEIIHPEIGEIGAWKTSGGSPIPKGALVEIWASSGAVHLAQSPEKLPVGVALNDTQYGEECRVLVYGISTVITDGETTPGMMLVGSPDNSGYVHPILNLDEESRVIGMALSAAKAGQPVVMALKSWGGL